MTTNYIDQLAEWWEGAETGPVLKGDLVIKRHPDGRYTIREAEKGWENTNYRILARAPKPKPAWHDAVAVIAEVHAFDLPRVFVKDDDGIWNDALTGRGYSSDALSRVTPLIEAKVTDEMVDRARDYMSINTGQTHTHNAIRGVITTALGLDPV